MTIGHDRYQAPGGSCPMLIYFDLLILCPSPLSSARRLSSGEGRRRGFLLVVSLSRNAVLYWFHGWRQLDSGKSVDGIELGLVRCGPSLVGRPLWAYALIQVEDEVSCTNESKPLALPWGRTPRLSSGVRVSTHVCQRNV